MVDDHLLGHAVLQVGSGGSEFSSRTPIFELDRSRTLGMSESLAFGFVYFDAELLLLPDAVGHVACGAAGLSLVLIVLVRVLRHVSAKLLVVEVHGVATASVEKAAVGRMEKETSHQVEEELHCDQQIELYRGARDKLMK